jgi:hypothetical protein
MYRRPALPALLRHALSCRYFKLPDGKICNYCALNFVV